MIFICPLDICAYKLNSFFYLFNNIHKKKHTNIFFFYHHFIFLFFSFTCSFCASYYKNYKKLNTKQKITLHNLEITKSSLNSQNCREALHACRNSAGASGPCATATATSGAWTHSGAPLRTDPHTNWIWLYSVSSSLLHWQWGATTPAEEKKRKAKSRFFLLFPNLLFSVFFLLCGVCSFLLQPVAGLAVGWRRRCVGAGGRRRTNLGSVSAAVFGPVWRGQADRFESVGVPLAGLPPVGGSRYGEGRGCWLCGRWLLLCCCRWLVQSVMVAGRLGKERKKDRSGENGVVVL